jgi:molybdopterin-binding protein
MSKDINVRWGWLKGMYIYTIVGAGGVGLGIILSIICTSINIGTTVSSQICAHSVAAVELQSGLVHWCHSSDSGGS